MFRITQTFVYRQLEYVKRYKPLYFCGLNKFNEPIWSGDETHAKYLEAREAFQLFEKFIKNGTDKRYEYKLI